jgi:23S rRNA (uridine2552-2'-O)-methyltransferase
MCVTRSPLRPALKARRKKFSVSQYKPKDFFFRKAKQQGLRARSAFKIEEIAKRFSLLKKGQSVLDLGAAPGGFLQVIASSVGAKGFVVGIDLVPIRPFAQANVKTAALDVLADDFDAQLTALYPHGFDVVVSDLAPKTSGIHSTDEARSIRLCEKALTLSAQRGKPGGAFMAKLFMGADFESFRNQVRAQFQEVKIVRPEATRGGSMEVYVVGLMRK